MTTEKPAPENISITMTTEELALCVLSLGRVLRWYAAFLDAPQARNASHMMLLEGAAKRVREDTDMVGFVQNFLRGIAGDRLAHLPEPTTEEIREAAERHLKIVR